MYVTCQMHSKKVLNNRSTHECYMSNALGNTLIFVPNFLNYVWTQGFNS